jgi:hypothetical protein
MMIYLRGMILEKGGGSTSSECWLELESNLRMMLRMKLTILRLGDADMGNGDVDMGDGDTGDSEDEYYKQVEQRRAAKLAAKAEMYSRCVSAL